MRPDRVVVASPSLNASLGIGQVAKPRLTQALVPEAPVEALDARQRDAVVIGQLIKLFTPELGPVAAHDVGA